MVSKVASGIGRDEELGMDMYTLLLLLLLSCFSRVLLCVTS